MPTSPIAPNTFAIRVPNPQKMTPCEEVVLGVFDFRKFVSEFYSWMFTTKLDENGNPVAVFTDDFKQMLCEAKAACVTTLSTTTTTVSTVSTTSSTSTSTSTTTPESINIVIQDDTTAAPYPSHRGIFGSPTPITGITVTLIGLTHGAPGDISALLVGPTGAMCMLMSHCGGTHAISYINLTFADGSPSLPTSGLITAGTYKPTSNTPPVMPSPAPSGPPYGTSLSVFVGTNPNGVWQLYILDDKVLDVGSLANWTLNITT